MTTQLVCFCFAVGAVAFTFGFIVGIGLTDRLWRAARRSHVLVKDIKDAMRVWSRK